MNKYDFSKMSRETLRVIKYMIDILPQKKLVTSKELGMELNYQGVALGGILGAHSKNKKIEIPIIIKAGKTTRVGTEKHDRPVQVWMINPQLKKEEIAQIN